MMRERERVKYVMNCSGGSIGCRGDRRWRRRLAPIVGLNGKKCMQPASSSRKEPHFPISRMFQLNQEAAAYLGAMIITLALLAVAPAAAVDCFKCSSRNGSNPACEDPFHNLNTTRVTLPVLPDPPPNVIYHTPCYAGRKGRDGLFPASACIKLTGTFDHTGETLVVRHCALDSGTLTQDTELGCVMACPNDACNRATQTLPPALFLGPLQFLLAAAFLHLYCANFAHFRRIQ